MQHWDDEKDVIVIGSGLAGLSAAIEAHAAGASVMVLEKMKITGGNTRISDGGVAAPNNYQQKKQGIEDSPELFYQDMLRAGLGLNQPGLLKVLAENANAAIDWTRHTLGVRYLDRVDRFGGHSVARCLTTLNHTGADFTKLQCRYLEEKGVAIRTRSLLTNLRLDHQGVVRGVQIRSDYDLSTGLGGRERNIRARRAVVLATGGYGSDVAFRMMQNPGLDSSVGTTNHRGATADGLVAALAIGAMPVHLSWIQLGPWGCVDESGYGRGASFASYGVYPTGILVDPSTGQRIVNEWADRRERSEAIMRTGHICVGITDARGANKAAESCERCLKRGIVKTFASLADLAGAFSMPPGRLEETVDSYNRSISEGRTDPFGKRLAEGAQPLDKPPFYTIRLWPKVHYTPGGVGINANAQVIDLTNRPIPRLFAAGEVCGGIHGASRLGSCSLTECIVFGRIAGQQAAALEPEEQASLLR